MSCKHNIFLNSNYEEQDTDRIEIDQALFRIKESLNKSENKINEALDSEVHRLTSSIAQAAEAAHHDLETTVSEINQNMTELENQLDANVILINSKIDNAETRVNSRVDNIIANSTSTEGNSELIDIRTGSDGRVYQSAGKAVRSQISDIKNTAVICANHRVTDSADEYYDANNVPPGKIIAYGNSGTNIPDLLGTLFCLEGTSANGRTQIYISRTAEILCRVRWNNVWTVWQSVNQTTANNILIANGFVSLGKIYSTTGINSANDILANTIYTIEGPFTISDLPDTLEHAGTIMTYSCRYDADASVNGTVQVYVDKTGKCAVRMKWSYSWTDWKIMPDFAQVESLINTGISNIMTPQNIHNAKGIALMGRLDDTSQIADADSIPANSVYLINNSGISGLPESADVFGTIMTYYDNDSNGPKNGTVQIYIDRTGKFFYRIKWSGNWSAWQYTPKASDISSAISIPAHGN